jgi:hypothetical protein
MQIALVWKAARDIILSYLLNQIVHFIQSCPRVGCWEFSILKNEVQPFLLEVCSRCVIVYVKEQREKERKREWLHEKKEREFFWQH